MKTKHTPGPWRVGATPPNGEQTIGTECGLMVAVATAGNGFGQTEANASLIAAAPDMYKALEKAQEFFITRMTQESCENAREAVRDALKKASG